MNEDDFSKVVEDAGGRYGRRSFSGYIQGYYNLPFGRRMTFVTLTSSGVKEQGQDLSGYFISREIAEDFFDKALREFIKDKEGSLHWRMQPTLSQEVFYKEDFDSFDSAQLKQKAGKIVLAPFHLWSVVARIAVDTFIPNVALSVVD